MKPMRLQDEWRRSTRNCSGERRRKAQVRVDCGVRGGAPHASLRDSDRSCRRAVSDPRSRCRRFLDSGAAQRRDRQFSRLGVRRVRLLSDGFCVARGGRRFWHADNERHLRHRCDAGDAADRGLRIRSRRGSVRPAANPCRRDRALFRSRAFVGLLAEPRFPDLRPRAVWHCDERGLGCRCIAHDGNYPAFGERHRLGSAPGRISYGVSHRRIGLRRSLSACRVARPVRDRRGAGIALHLCDAKRSGIDGLDGCARNETRERRGGAEGALATGDLRHPSDDRVQLSSAIPLRIFIRRSSRSSTALPPAR